MRVGDTTKPEGDRPAKDDNKGTLLPSRAGRGGASGKSAEVSFFGAPRRGGKRGGAWVVTLVLGSLAALGFFLLRDFDLGFLYDLSYDLVGLSAVAAIQVGVRVNRPERPLPWHLFCLGQSMFVLGDLTLNVYENVLDVEAPFPSLSDAFWLSGYPILAGGLVLLIRSRAPGRDWVGLIDAAIIATSMGVVSWVFLMRPYADDPGLSSLEQAISIVYPLSDVLLLAVAARLAVAPGARTPAYRLLGLSLTLLLLADTVYARMLLEGTYRTGSLPDLGFLLSYVFWASAALHPTMATLCQPAPERRVRLTWSRLSLLAGAALVAPAVRLVQLVRGEPVDVPVIVGGAAALFLLVIARMAVVVRSHERAVDRETVLKKAGAALVAAPDREGIYAAALRAILELAGGASGTRAVVAAGSAAGGMVVVAAAGDGAERAEGAHIIPDKLPEPLRAGLLGERAGMVEQDVPGGLKEGLGFEPRGGTVIAIPLLGLEGTCAALLVDEDARLSDEFKYGLEALGSQVALALESEALAEDLHARRSEERFRSLIQNASDLIMILGFDGLLLYVSPSVERILGRPPKEAEGAKISRWVHPDDAHRMREALLGCAATRGGTATTDLRLLRADGGWRRVEMVVNNLLHEPEVGGIVLNARDVTERKALEERLSHQAFHDDLTGLPNRALFLDRLGHALSRVDRDGKKVALLFLDLDGFKVVNDSLGHRAGDELLVAVAERLLSCSRPGDTVARLGGDEFTLLLEGVEEESEAVEVANRIPAKLREPFDLEGHEVVVTASIGISLGTSEDRPDGLLRSADVAMYEAKNKGKARHKVFDPEMDDRALKRLRTESQLRHALREGEFRVHYQPLVDLGTGRICEVEALVRWEHPERGLVQPGQFVPLAEETGLIVPIGMRVLEEACRRVRSWQERFGGTPLALSVNLSPKQFQHPGLVEDVLGVLHRTGLDPRDLKLEITEGVVMEDAEATVALLHRLKDVGVRLAIDDFGTGYSSLAYLKRFPVDVLKIDRSFVAGLGRVPEDTAVVRATVAFAKSMGLSVTAEGIETAEQLTYVQALGCDLGQGFYLHRPIPTGAILDLLETETLPGSKDEARAGEEQIEDRAG